jgi:hypothetical protein
MNHISKLSGEIKEAPTAELIDFIAYIRKNENH